MTTTVDAPARVDDVQLLGEMAGSGYRTPPSLVRRADGQTLQLTTLLYHVLEAVDGRRSSAEIADVVSHAMQRGVTAELVDQLLDQQLRPLGLVKLADGSQPETKRSDPLLGLRFRVSVTDPERTRRITDPFRILFRPLVTAAVMLGFLAITWWVFFREGLAPAAYDAFDRPHLLLLVFVVTVLSGGFHEFGHAAAARYGGAEPGVMGAGLYLVWPAFYTDVTDSYRLGRAGRIRTDLGGLYFNAIVVVLTYVAWYTTGWDALLLLVATQVFQMVQQLLPLLRFDGYHLLADIAGVPDLYHRIRPILVGILPHRWKDPENAVLKPGARALVTLWVLVTLPMMALMLLALIGAVPRMLGSAWSVVTEDAAGLADAWDGGDVVDIVAHGLQVLAIVLPVVAAALILGRVSGRWLKGLTTWSQGSAVKRALAVALTTTAVTGLAWAWWPGPGDYRPIGPDERGLITQALPFSAAPPPASAGLASPPRGLSDPGAAAQRRLDDDAPLSATFADEDSLPTEADPQLAMVLVPSDRDDGTAPAPNPASPSEDAWVFPFDKPLAPEEGDNQAVAVNTTDDSVVYDVAFALVWAEGDEVLNVNEAHAYASCQRCVTVAVAFQVVLIMDNAHVVVPQNLAVAANYDCYRCITAAIANQLVLSLPGEPGEEQLLALGAVWSRLAEFGRTITQYSLADITAQLEEFKAEIVEILGAAPAVTTDPEATTAPSTGEETEAPGEEETPVDGTEPEATESPGTEPSAEPTEEPVDDPTTEPGTTPAPAPTSAPAPAPESPAAEPAPSGTTTP